MNERTDAETARIPLAQKTNAQGTLVLREGDFIKIRGVISEEELHGSLRGAQPVFQKAKQEGIYA